MENTGSVFWFQGLFLQPQHMQVMERQHERRLQSVLQETRPHAWGVQELVVDSEALLSHQFAVVQLKAVLPEGTQIAYPGNAIVVPRLVEKNMLQHDRSCIVYIGVRHWDVHGGNVTVIAPDASPANVSSRYLGYQSPELQPDLYIQGAPPGNIHRIRYVVRIFFEPEVAQMAGYDLLAVTRLYKKDDQLFVDESYAPPLFSYGASQVVSDVVKDIRELVVFRAMQLQDYKIHGEQRVKDFDPGYLIFLLSLQTLNRYVQPLIHIVETPNLSPWEVYGVLRQFIGELSVFVRDLSPTGARSDGTQALLPYDHENVYSLFIAARELIKYLIERLGTSIEFLVRLEPQDILLQAELPERIFKHYNQFWIIVQTENEDTELLVDDFMRTAKLSAPSNMSSILVRAVPGIPFTHYQMPPAGLPKKTGSYYFQLDTQNSYWIDVDQEKQIALFWEARPDDVEVYLAVVRAD